MFKAFTQNSDLSTLKKKDFYLMQERKVCTLVKSVRETGTFVLYKVNQLDMHGIGTRMSMPWYFVFKNDLTPTTLVVLGLNATLTAKVVSWWSVTHMCFLAFSHQY